MTFPFTFSSILRRSRPAAYWTWILSSGICPIAAVASSPHAQAIRHPSYTALCGTLLSSGKLFLLPVAASPGCREPLVLPVSAAGEPGQSAVAPDAV